MSRGRANTLADVMQSVEKTSDCWLWKGMVDRKGYGKFRMHSRFIGTHRVSYMLHKGAIPEGMWVLHHCDNPSCVNPSHLYLGTQIDNERDKVQRNRHHHTMKTHCPKGHEYTGDNLIQELRPSGRYGRRCRACKNHNAKLRRGRA